MQVEEDIFSEENFKKHFFDVRTHKPQKDQIIACFTIMADLRDGSDKRHLVDLLCHHNCPAAAVALMTNTLHATEIYSYQVPIAIVDDLLNGMSTEEVLEKPYRYQIELFYYTKAENVPKNDPHWSLISILTTDKILHSKIVF